MPPAHAQRAALAPRSPPPAFVEEEGAQESSGGALLRRSETRFGIKLPVMAEVATALTILALVAALAALFVGIRTLRLSPVRSDLTRDDYGDDDLPAGVREPRRPPPASGSAAALADPD